MLTSFPAFSQTSYIGSGMNLEQKRRHHVVLIYVFRNTNHSLLNGLEYKLAVTMGE